MVRRIEDPRLSTADLWRDPFPLFARLRANDPVWRMADDVFLVSTWDLVAEAVSRVQDVSNHFGYTLFTRDDGTLGALQTGMLGPDVFAGADPPVHGPQRKIFLAELTQSRIDPLEAWVRGITDEALDPLVAAGAGDAARCLAHVIPMRVMVERVIGYADPSLDQVRRWTFDGSRLAGGLMTLDQMGALAGDVAGMATWTEAQLDGALTSTCGGPLLRATAAAVSAGELTREEAAFTLMVLVGAGAETTTSLIGIAIALLASRPDLQAELRDDLSKVPAFVEEVLRFDSPFRYHPRTAARPTRLGGVDIPAGALVLLLWASANRDGAVFEDPDEFMMGRANAHQHFGFGRGIHHCVGAALARMEARVVLARLLERTSSIDLDPAAAPSWSESVWINRHDSLPIRVRR